MPLVPACLPFCKGRVYICISASYTPQSPLSHGQSQTHWTKKQRDEQLQQDAEQQKRDPMPLHRQGCRLTSPLGGTGRPNIRQTTGKGMSSACSWNCSLADQECFREDLYSYGGFHSYLLFLCRVLGYHTPPRTYTPTHYRCTTRVGSHPFF